MKKSIFVLIVLMAIFSLVPVLSARAGALTSVTVSPTNIYGGYNADYTVNFTTATTILTASTTKLEFTAFPAGFNVVSAATSTTGLAVATVSVSGQKITLQLVANTAFAAGVKTLVITNIVSPSAGGSSFTVTIRTLGDEEEVDTGTSAAFSIFGGQQTPSLYSDAMPPTSKITSPTDGLTISLGEKYAIQGTAQDQGGSTVQKVEVSLDGGQNWSITEIKSALANVFSWEYVWQNPTRGEYVIKVRATDAVGNIASPSAGVKVTVSAAESVVVPPAVSPEKPITEMTAQELETKIIEIQQKIVDVLQQLIQLFQQQVQALLAK